MCQHLIGGPRTLSYRYLEGSITFPKDVVKQVLCKKLVGLDVNTLYLHCCSHEMPMGFYIDYAPTAADWLQPSSSSNQSAGVLEWLTHIATSWGIHIQHVGRGNFVIAKTSCWQMVWKHRNSFWICWLLLPWPRRHQQPSKPSTHSWTHAESWKNKGEACIYS